MVQSTGAWTRRIAPQNFVAALSTSSSPGCVPLRGCAAIDWCTLIALSEMHCVFLLCRKCSPPSGCGVRSTSTTSSCPLPSTAPGPRGTLTSTTARGKRLVFVRYELKAKACLPCSIQNQKINLATLKVLDLFSVPAKTTSPRSLVLDLSCLLFVRDAFLSHQHARFVDVSHFVGRLMNLPQSVILASHPV